MEVQKIIVAIIIKKDDATKIKSNSDLYDLFAGLENGCVTSYGMNYEIEAPYELLLCESCNEPIISPRYIIDHGYHYHLKCVQITDEELL